MDIHIVGERELPVCEGSRIKRRLVLNPGDNPMPNSPQYVMDIPDDNIVVFREGVLDTHLIVSLPAAPRPGTHWSYQPTPVNGCPWWLRFVPWYHAVGRSVGPVTPVTIEDKTSTVLTQRLPFLPNDSDVTPDQVPSLTP